MTIRRARLAGATFVPPELYRPHAELTKAEYAEALRHAELNLDDFPHVPEYELERCEFCNRPDWESPGNCLARVRANANKLGALAVALEDLEARIPRATPLSDEQWRALLQIRHAVELLGKVGVTASAHREWLAARGHLQWWQAP